MCFVSKCVCIYSKGPEGIEFDHLDRLSLWAVHTADKLPITQTYFRMQHASKYQASKHITARLQPILKPLHLLG